MSAFFTWFITTRAGRMWAVIVAALAAFFLALVRTWQAGRNFEQSKHNRASSEAWQERSEKDDEISKLDERRARGELARWMQPGTDRR